MQSGIISFNCKKIIIYLHFQYVSSSVKH
jgi:hypothetical protein